MTLRIDIPEQTERELRERAEAAGKDIDTFVLEAVEEKLLRGKSFRELLGPVHKEFEQSGMTEEELNALVEKAREEVWQEQQARRAKASRSRWSSLTAWSTSKPSVAVEDRRPRAWNEC